MNEQPRASWIDRLSGWSWHLGLELVFWSAGGLLVSLTEPPGPDADDVSVRTVLSVAVVVGALLAAAAGLRLRARRRGKWLLFSTLLHGMLLVMTAVVAELAIRPSIPEWPGRELHGVAPDVWARSQSFPMPGRESSNINTWGQRDRERQLVPPTGSFRIACIGDSFLEEGTSEPVSLLIELRLGRDDVDVVNLGVSATDPDEYYDRTCRVAIPLNAGHCLLFLYAGNDFVSVPRSLESFSGIAAVGPRPSLLRRLGLEGVNHVLMNHRRPVIQAWFASGDLAEYERGLHATIVNANDEQLRFALLNADELVPADRARLAERLSQPEMAVFFQILREPDEGKFRSYYLSSALWAASVGRGQWERDSPASALYWVGQTVDHCRERGVEVTVVIIPDGFQVDPRLAEQWAPLADMKHLTQPKKDAAAEFRDQGLARGWDVLDLHEALEGIPGTYLNLDGHWSAAGAAAAADAIVEHLKKHHGY